MSQRVKRPWETKVIASIGAAILSGSVVSAFAIWLIGVLAYSAPSDSAHVTAAIAAVPSVVQLVVEAFLLGVGTALGGYSAPHTHRPDLVTHPLTSHRRGAPEPAPVGIVWDKTVTTELPTVPPGPAPGPAPGEQQPAPVAQLRAPPLRPRRRRLRGDGYQPPSVDHPDDALDVMGG